MQTEARDALQT